jgi:hypothetical protein
MNALGVAATGPPAALSIAELANPIVFGMQTATGIFATVMTVEAELVAAIAVDPERGAAPAPLAHFVLGQHSGRYENISDLRFWLAHQTLHSFGAGPPSAAHSIGAALHAQSDQPPSLHTQPSRASNPAGEQAREQRCHAASPKGHGSSSENPRKYAHPARVIAMSVT